MNFPGTEFLGTLPNFILEGESDKYDIYILGDMNMHFLTCATHSQTVGYLDMLYSNSFLPVITKPTRITAHAATLIDHIYINTAADIISGIELIDISDHRPTFCIVDVSVNHPRNKIQLRDYTHFSQELYRQDINAIDCGLVLLVQTPSSMI